MRDIIVIAHNIRSTHNVGSLLRTCEGLGVTKIYFTGYTPYPRMLTDIRLPHISRKINTAIQKTALGTEQTQVWKHVENIHEVITSLTAEGYSLCALEQTKNAQKLPDFKAPSKIALLLGSEVTGIQSELLEIIPIHLIIPMFGSKESFNVVQAAAMSLYHLRFR
jgi:23S rRNA (guanosine2251-2'-O)-methyltransferase